MDHSQQKMVQTTVTGAYSINRMDTLIFFHVNITSFAGIIKILKMNLLTFLVSYATRYAVMKWISRFHHGFQVKMGTK
jgi:hypothetical protein